MFIRDFIRKKVESIKKKYNTNDPAIIAEKMNIIVIYQPLNDEVCGFYHYYKKNKVIVINSNVEEHRIPCILSHEIGHAVLHPKLNIVFQECNTFYSKNKYELEANMFAAELMIADEKIKEFSTVNEASSCLGLPKEFIEIKYQNII